MPCFRPLRGYRSKTLNPSGKRSIVFNLNEGYKDMPVDLPCGQCIGCRLEHSKKWAIRIVHEASLYDHNSFITLTYSQQHLPINSSLQLEDVQKFMKRLRKYLTTEARRLGIPVTAIRYFHCGEYGERLGRPHYHMCLFNYDFSDKVHKFTTQNGDKVYTSETLDRIWSKGNTTIGAVTFESAAYAARYITKKVNGPLAEDHYQVINEETGETLSPKRKEYVTMSKGIGKGWFEKYKSDVYPSDFIVLRGKRLRVPKYYDVQLEKLYPEEFKRIKARRKDAASVHVENNSSDRLRVREEVQERRIKQLKRNYENEA